MYFIFLEKNVYCTEELKEGLVEAGHLSWVRNGGVQLDFRQRNVTY